VIILRKLIINILILVCLFGFNLAFSSENNLIVCIAESNGQKSLLLIAPFRKIRIVRRIPLLMKDIYDPCLSSDGKKIAFAGTFKNKIELFMIGVDENFPIKLTDLGGLIEKPCFSPDNQNIVFSFTPYQNQFYPSAIYNYNISAKKLTQIIPREEAGKSFLNFPRFSKDGSKLVYTSAQILKEGFPKYGGVTLKLFDFRTNQSKILTGGATYFDATGKSVGFWATAPSFKDSDNIVFLKVKHFTDTSICNYNLTTGRVTTIYEKYNEMYRNPFYIKDALIFEKVNTSSNKPYGDSASICMYRKGKVVYLTGQLNCHSPAP